MAFPSTDVLVRLLVALDNQRGEKKHGIAHV
jgi:hypothetical protein